MSNKDKPLVVKGEDPLDRVGRREKEYRTELGEKPLARRILIKAAGIACRFWWLGVLLFLALWALMNPTVINLALLGLSFVWQMVFAVLFKWCSSAPRRSPSHLRLRYV
ncbi:MAG: hypothetical protein ACC647_08140 [Anaerolineales bacterium]